ncbi:MAG: YggS family pyridoxal phosphate-dependent enzyme [Thermoguttaceae bacterium]
MSPVLCRHALRVFEASFSQTRAASVNMSNAVARIAENVAEVRGRIATAAARSGRAADAVTLVAVTKYVSDEAVRGVVAAGCKELGESRPQQIWQRASDLVGLPIRWHMIGHLQRNKVRRTLPVVSLIHSVDSARLLAAIDEELAHLPAASSGEGRRPDAGDTAIRRQAVLLEVNVSGETAKHGLRPAEVEPLLASLAECRHVGVRGLMCMAGLEGDLDTARREFASLRELRDHLRPRCPPEATLDELSMGMSGDFEVAVEEGATLVRVGSALFEGIAN